MARKVFVAGMLKEEVLENRDLRDVMDRVMDKGIVLDPADRLGLAGGGHLEHERIVVGAFDTRLDKDAA